MYYFLGIDRKVKLHLLCPVCTLACCDEYIALVKGVICLTRGWISWQSPVQETPCYTYSLCMTNLWI